MPAPMRMSHLLAVVAVAVAADAQYAPVDPYYLPAVGTQQAAVNQHSANGVVSQRADTASDSNAADVHRAVDQLDTTDDNLQTATIAGGGLGPDGVHSASAGEDAHHGTIRYHQGTLDANHAGTTRRTGSALDSLTNTASNVGRSNVNTAVNVPTVFGPASYSAFDNQLVQQRGVQGVSAGQQSSYGEVEDGSLQTFNFGSGEKRAAQRALVQQGLFGYAPSYGEQVGSASSDNTNGFVSKQNVLQTGRTAAGLAAAHDNVGTLQAGRGYYAFTPVGVAGVGVGIDQVGWDRGAHQAQAVNEFANNAYDNAALVNHNRQTAGADSKVALGAGVIPGGASLGVTRAGVTNDGTSYGERSVGNDLATRQTTSALNTFDVGGQTVVGATGALLP